MTQEKEPENTSNSKQDRIKTLIVAAGLVAVFVVVAALAALTGSNKTLNSNSNSKLSQTDKLLIGIPQNESLLGELNAPVTLVKFGDLQCPACKLYTEQLVKGLIENQVRDGDLKIDFQNLPILGQDSVIAARAALAAQEQGVYWQFIKNFYLAQGEEGSGYVTAKFLNKIAIKSGVEDVNQFEEDWKSDKFNQQLSEVLSLADKLQFTGTPTFAFRDSDGGLRVIEIQQPEDLNSIVRQEIKDNSS